MTKTTEKSLTPRQKAGLRVAPGRITSIMRDHTGKRISKKAAIVLGSVLDHVTTEVLHQSKLALGKGVKTINYDALKKGITTNENLKVVFKKYSFVSDRKLKMRKSAKKKTPVVA